MGVAVYDSLQSTNKTLLETAAGGQGEGTWIMAKVQTGGRGRQGRAWQSLPGNLHASTLVRAWHTDPAAASLSLVAAVALHRTIVAETSIAAARLRIKWPNDLVVDVGGEWRKLAGILLEREGAAVVIGFGVNLAHAPDLPDRKSACAADFGEAPDRRWFCLALGRKFTEELERWRTRGLGDTRHRWLDRAHPTGSPISVHVSADETASGTFDGIEPDGALRLCRPDGSIEVVRAGDVSLS